MRYSCYLAALSAITAPSCPLASPLEQAALVSQHNANHIFNAIHSAARQWGSSLQHNGFSFYLATVPQGTRLYHGRHDPGPLHGVDWVAFEPEHGLLFSLPSVESPPGGLYPDPGDDEVVSDIRTANQYSYSSDAQEPLRPRVPLPQKQKKGYLLTYKAPRDLKFLYIDGMGAAKVAKGTMDSQNHVLLNITENPDIAYDGIRAQELCRLIREEWQSKLDGFIRMESGFEAIVCSIDNALEEERVQETLAVPSFGELNAASTFFNEIRAAAKAYHGYEDGRISLDPDSLVTGYVYLSPEFEQEEMPRLRNLSDKARARLRREVTQMVIHGPSQTDQINWQAVADNVLKRYARNLKYLLVPSVAQDPDALLRELEHILNPYVDKAARDAKAEAARCAHGDVPTSPSTSTSARAITYVAQSICGALVTAAYELYAVQSGLPLQKELARAGAMERIQSLIDYLQWPIWKECSGCPDDRVCLVAMFPWGNQEDHDHPSCLNATQLLGRNGYWLEWPY